MSTPVSDGRLLDNDYMCGQCGESVPHRTIHDVPQPNSWEKVRNWQRKHPCFGRLPK